MLFRIEIGGGRLSRVGDSQETGEELLQHEMALGTKASTSPRNAEGGAEEKKVEARRRKLQELPGLIAQCPSRAAKCSLQPSPNFMRLNRLC